MCVHRGLTGRNDCPLTPEINAIYTKICLLKNRYSTEKKFSLYVSENQCAKCISEVVKRT